MTQTQKCQSSSNLVSEPESDLDGDFDRVEGFVSELEPGLRDAFDHLKVIVS